MQQIPSELPANALGLAVTTGACLLLLVLPRRWAMAPVILICGYMTTEQSLAVAGFHFTMIRLLIAAGWLRVLLRGELRGIVWSRMDRMICWWVVVDVIAYIVLWHNGDAVVYKLGFIYTILGAYFLFRMLLHDISDVLQVCKTLALFTIPLAILMLLEKATGNNLFSIFGGVSSVTAMRDGVLRCQGPFAHPILAGTFGATIFPLVAVLWLDGAIGRLLAVCGMTSALTIAFTSGSSGPIMALLAGAMSLALWRMRTHMSLLRRGIVASLICLQLLMKVPVWFILARIDIFSGSTGFHRAMLIDSAVRNLDSWWLVGTKSTLSWASEDQGLFDVTNQYLQVGAEGGLVAMLMFIWIIVTAFSMVGLTWREMEDLGEPDLGQILVWGMGAALLAHAVSYISVSYFDQNLVNWYLLLAMIATVWGEFSLATDASKMTLSDSIEEEERVLVGADPATWLKSLFSLHPAMQH
jgi:hypothetical protein